MTTVSTPHSVNQSTNVPRQLLPDSEYQSQIPRRHRRRKAGKELTATNAQPSRLCPTPSSPPAYRSRAVRTEMHTSHSTQRTNPPCDRWRFASSRALPTWMTDVAHCRRIGSAWPLKNLATDNGTDS